MDKPLNKGSPVWTSLENDHFSIFSLFPFCSLIVNCITLFSFAFLWILVRLSTCLCLMIIYIFFLNFLFISFSHFHRDILFFIVSVSSRYNKYIVFDSYSNFPQRNSLLTLFVINMSHKENVSNKICVFLLLLLGLFPCSSILSKYLLIFCFNVFVASCFIKYFTYLICMCVCAYCSRDFIFLKWIAG